MSSLRAVAFHEAGHAVAHVVLRRPFGDTTILPIDSTEGSIHTTLGTVLRPFFDSRRVARDAVLMTLAGPLAQWQAEGYKPEADIIRDLGASDELEFAVGVARTAIVPGGEIESAREYVRHAMPRALGLVMRWCDAIEAVAAALIRDKTLTATEVRRIARATRGHPRKQIDARLS